MKVRLEWKGAELRDQVARAELAGVQATVEAAADRARRAHPRWRNRTGQTERSIAATRAERQGEGAAARVGFGVDHGVFLEHRDQTIERAAEQEFPRLGERIKRELT